MTASFSVQGVLYANGVPASISLPKSASAAKPPNRRKKKPKPNSRRKTGGQPGHKGHGRKRLEPDTEVILPVPVEIGNSPDWAKTGQDKRRQIVGIKLVVYATDYVSEEYENVHTGKLYSPPFPKAVPNDVNYADDLKAALLYLT